MRIKLGHTPGPVVDLILIDGSNLNVAIAAANAEQSRFQFKTSDRYTRNGIALELTTILRDGDVVIQAENLKGAMPLATVSRVPGKPVEIAVPEGCTYKQVIDMAVAEAQKQGRTLNGSLDKTSVRVDGNVIVDPVNTVIPNTGVVIGLYENLKGAR